MTATQPPQRKMIQPPQRRLAEIGRVEFDENDIAAVDRCLEDIKIKFSHLIREETEKLRVAWDAALASATAEAFRTCLVIAHDLSGFGGTLGYPLVTALSRSLCRVLNQVDCTLPGARVIVDAHIRALQVVAKDRVVGNGGSVGVALTQALNDAITKFNHGSIRLGLIPPP
jgi:hypothetical protein